MAIKQPLLASALAAIGALLCCVARLLLVALGVGSGWMTTLTTSDARVRVDPLAGATAAAGCPSSITGGGR